jgi:hypothetical protein
MRQAFDEYVRICRELWKKGFYNVTRENTTIIWFVCPITRLKMRTKEAYKYMIEKGF